MSLEFISQICILLSTKSPGDGDHKHTVTHTHTHIEYKVSERRKGKIRLIREKYLIQSLLKSGRLPFTSMCPTLACYV